jgi:hypothetical protein
MTVFLDNESQSRSRRRCRHGRAGGWFLDQPGGAGKKKASATTLVFTPVKSKTTEEHGAAQIEEDQYALEQGGKVLRLVYSRNDVMVSHKRAHAK